MKKPVLLVVSILCLWLLCGCFSQQPEITTPPQAPPTSHIQSIKPITEPSTPAQTPELTAEPTVPDQTPEPTPTPIAQPTAQPTPTPQPTPAQTPSEGPAAMQYEDMKAMWLSQYDLLDIYTEDGSQRDIEDFTARMAQVLDNVKDESFNTVFLQIRPFADSMYPSQFYPMSSFVVGQIGAEAKYDPVAITVRLAHERGLSIHAWINPLRGMYEKEIQLVGQEYALRRWYDDLDLRGKYIVAVNGRWYLNPAYEEVRELICAGAEEALRLYDFDGLHMDDYFYPTTDSSFDAEAYAAYMSGGGTMNLADFRRNNVNLLVESLYSLTHVSRDGRIFGISPGGNADTAYNSQYADIYTWCANEDYLDYICPQVYFGLEHGSYDFVKVCARFQDMIKTDSVDLIIGMTFGKAFSKEDQWAGSGKDEWKNNDDVLLRSLQTTLNLKDCRGVAVFCYQYFYEPLSGEEVAGTAAERENFMSLFRDVSWK